MLGKAESAGDTKVPASQPARASGLSHHSFLEQRQVSQADAPGRYRACNLSVRSYGDHLHQDSNLDPA